uniref:Rx N-terminal domain-containing protein n=1 Tax=Aegilops tauschii TaxID=37682 RepID=M8CSI9_AEGTA
MEAVISAVLGDLVGRAISFVIKKRREQTTAEEDLQRLRQLLLRISAVVEEAEGRCRERKTNDEEASRFLFAQSDFNPAKRFRLLSSNTQIESTVIGRESSQKLKQVVIGLENMVADMKEFAMFLMSYPRMYRQPYGAYLFVDKYMFGRQMEREQSISVLLQAEPPGNGNVGVLTIVGPARVGKSTLVDHVCNDERVRNHFSLILLYTGNNLQDETMTTFRDHCVIKHQNISLDEEKMLVFGSTDPEEQPKLTSIAMEIALEMRESFIYAYVVAALLRENFSARFWCRVLRHLREHRQKNILLLGEYPAEEDQPRYICSLAKRWRGSEYVNFLLRCSDYQNGPASHSGIPRIKVMDLLSGTWSAIPRGKFEVLSWRSLIPPYYSYTTVCEFVRHEKYHSIDE